MMVNLLTLQIKTSKVLKDSWNWRLADNLSALQIKTPKSLGTYKIGCWRIISPPNKLKPLNP